MALTYAQYKAATVLAAVGLTKITVTMVGSGRLWSRWQHAPTAGVAPSTPAAPNASTVGALNQGQLSATPTWIKTARYSHSTGPILIVDRLSHQGGLSGAVSGVVTTNLPTAALTRFTSGVGVMALVEQAASVGTTPTTFTCSYTNSAGVSGRVSPLITFGGDGDIGMGMAIPIPLRVGDVGIRSIESVTLAGTTGTAGDFGVVLVKPLAIVHSWDECHHWVYDNVRDLGAWFESAPANPCLSYYALSSGAGFSPMATYYVSGSLDLIPQV